MCDHHLLDDPAGLTCTRADIHATGHTYESSTGSSVPDPHTEHVDD
jgi:hypothetical protein